MTDANARPWPEGRPTPLIVAVALTAAVGPFLVQAVTLVLTHSLPWTVIAGAAFAVLVIAGALMAASRAGRPNAGSIISVVLAVLTYHALAFVLAYLSTMVFFDPH
jgi:hypothetical protein